MSQRGLTLLEMLVALGLMALLLVIAIPSMTGGSVTLRLESAAREIADDLRQAHAAAIAGNRTIAFRLDVASGTFSHDGAKQHGGADAGIHLALFTTEQQRINGHLGTIQFFADGGSTGGGIELSAGSRRVMVLVDWLTGHVSLAPEPASGAS
jgi:general secretion pathway protein H